MPMRNIFVLTPAQLATAEGLDDDLNAGFSQGTPWLPVAKAVWVTYISNQA